MRRTSPPLQYYNTEHGTIRKATRYNSKNVLSGLLVCQECGRAYRGITKHDGSVIWRCANRVEHGSKFCKQSPSIPEEPIFNGYLQGDSFHRIASKLYELQIPSPTGKEKWTAAAINKLLSNEKYTGDVILQKTYIQDFWNHTQAENDWVLLKYLKEIFEQVQAAKSSRSNVEIAENGEVKRKSTGHSSNSGLSGKIRCTICGWKELPQNYNSQR